MLNRSFNGPERGGPASPSLPQRQRAQPPRGRTLGAVIKEKDDELALFLEMRKREKERQNSLLFTSPVPDELDRLPESKQESSPMFKMASSAPIRRTGPDDFLNSDSNKNDYDWLLTPPGTPLFPSLEKEAQRSPADRVGTPKTRPTSLKSRLADPLHSSGRVSSVSKQPMSSGTASLGIRRPSSSGGLGAGSARPSTPTGRLPQSLGSRPARASTPTSRPTVTATAPAPRRSSTPTATRSSSSVVSSAPNIRPAPPSRSFTPTRGPPAPSSMSTRSSSTVSATSTRTSSASSVIPTRSSSTASATPTRASSTSGATAVTGKKTPVPSARGASPTVRSRPWKATDMPGFSLDAPPNLKTALPERPSSAARGRPTGVRSASVEAVGSGSTIANGGGARGRRQSCSPSRSRAVTASSGGPTAAKNRPSIGGGEDSISPVVVGTKMVERVVNLRRLAPPKRDDRGSPSSSSSSSRGGRLASSSPSDSSGFGRTLSNKSLDMAMRHMDIRRSIPSSLRPLMASVPASSMYSVRSGPGRSRGLGGVADSPLATSSNASSSELSLGNPRCLYASEAEDDAKETRSTASSLPQLLPLTPPTPPST